MRGVRADGRPFVVKGEYRVVQRPTLLEFTWLPDWQGDGHESLVRIELTDTNGVTRLRLTHSGLRTEKSRESHRSWPQLLAWVKTYVESIPAVSATFHGVRYQVKDVKRAVEFYTGHFGFSLEHQHPPAFANVSLGPLSVLLSGPGASGSRPLTDGRTQEPGGWNRIVLKVANLDSCIEALKAGGIPLRNQIEAGPGGRQVQVEDPDGNPIELFEPR
jgi:glyoxylase I family protein